MFFYRDDTALDCINTILHRTGGDQNAVRKAMIGSIVVTHYNNDKTYRVDEVRFDVNPLCKCDILLHLRKWTTAFSKYEIF